MPIGSDAQGEVLNEAEVRRLAAEAADTAGPYKDDAFEAAEQFANLANTMSEYVVDSLSRSVASRPMVSLAAAAGAGFLLGQWSLGGRR
jgi:hypothetical protein